MPWVWYIIGFAFGWWAGLGDPKVGVVFGSIAASIALTAQRENSLFKRSDGSPFLSITHPVAWAWGGIAGGSMLGILGIASQWPSPFSLAGYPVSAVIGEFVLGHIGWIVGGAIGVCVGYQHTLRIAVPKGLNAYAAGLFLYEEACIVASRALRGAGESQHVLAYADYLVLMAASMRARAVERLAGRKHEISDWYHSDARGWPQRPSGRKHEVSCPAMTYIRLAYDDALYPISAADALESGDELADRAFDIAKSTDKDHDDSYVNHIYARLAFERAKGTLHIVKIPLSPAKVEVHDQILNRIETDVKLADNDVRVTMIAAGVEPPKYAAFDLESLEAIYSLELI